MRGRFITFEGSEGCGKTTQIQRLSERLKEEGREVLLTREPGGTGAGEKIRDLLQHAPEGEGLTAEAEVLLFTASRAQLVREQVVPAIERGVYVLADRFLDSTTVYQGMARGLDAPAVAAINRFAVGECMPDMTFLLDLPVHEGRRRVSERSPGEEDRMERESDDFFEKVRAGYLDLADSEPERFIVLDAMKTPDQIAREIWNYLGDQDGTKC
ncbi:MAG: dTMP kinase [Verrucomicrobiales bacterium]|nr:dTMP kinase [Verrucomicrobiales bacterium]